MCAANGVESHGHGELKEKRERWGTRPGIIKGRPPNKISGNLLRFAAAQLERELNNSTKTIG
jgi:hypothetical protein